MIVRSQANLTLKPDTEPSTSTGQRGSGSPVLIASKGKATKYRSIVREARVDREEKKLTRAVLKEITGAKASENDNDWKPGKKTAKPIKKSVRK